MARVTLKDVAHKAGVSYQTVSKVLRNKSNVSPDTEARIHTAVAELGYKPNISARNLRTQSSNLIGYAWRRASGENSHPILDIFLASTALAVESKGFHLLTFLIGDDAHLDTAAYNNLYAKRQVEGFVLADTNYNDPRIAFLIEQGIPFVSFGQANPAWDFCWVDVNNEDGMRQVAQHLLDKNHERLALLSWPEGSQAGYFREQGFLQTVAAAGIPAEQVTLLRGDNNVRYGNQAVQQLLAMPLAQRPTAVACVTDTIAIGVLNALTAAGYTVGQDIAVTGYDNIPMAEFLYPPLTSVRQPIAAVGQKLVELLFQQINDEPIEEKGILLSPQLIVRESSG